VTSILQKERDRQQAWLDRGLADPLAILGAERIARELYAEPTFRSPLRPPLDAYFAAHPDERPGWWDL